jgi:hypothetical protein
MNSSSLERVPPEAVKALESGDFKCAIEILESEVQRAKQPTAHLLAALALAYFQSQQYDKAQRHYEAAVKLEPQRVDWSRMLELARANETAAVEVHVPSLHYFDHDTLLAPPLVPEHALPTPPPPRQVGIVKRSRIALGKCLGVIVTALMDTITGLWGRFVGYKDAVWTNWYRHRLPTAILTLAYMRDRLNAHNLQTTYPQGSLIAFQHKGQTPPPGVTHFRTADGSWNNLDNPKEGAAGTRFLRNVDLRAAIPDPQLLIPNPREVSLTFLTRTDEMKEIRFLNMVAAAWIAFMNADWINHGEIRFDKMIEIPLPEDDPARSRYMQTKMLIGITQPDPTRRGNREEVATGSINEVTHWWDGSQIYGSDQATQNRLRRDANGKPRRDGKLQLNDDGTLPVDDKGIEQTGFTRNWWVGLAMLHTLFAREHNAICDHLMAAYSDWDDNRFFNVARLINAAVMAKIHSVEWTPAILPNPALEAGLNANWYGLLTNFLRKPKARKTLSEIKVCNPEMGGVVGNPINKHGEPYGFSEEFVEIYRLHSLLPETLTLRRRESSAQPEIILFPAARQSGSVKITRRYSMADLFFSFGTQHPGQLVLNNYPSFMQELSIPGFPFFDMGTVDIVRARERGVPRYNEFRRQLGLNPIRTFEDLTDNPEHLHKLKKVYGSGQGDVEKLDLMIGTLAEEHRPTGFGFGETMFQIFILNATRRLQADRFYTDCYNEEVYTPEGLRWIDETDLKTVILRHYPELASTGLANIKNAFEPWDVPSEEGRLRPERHPLRAFDQDLKPDPWCVEAHRHQSTTFTNRSTKYAAASMIIWFMRKWFWNLLGWAKMAANKPLTIPLPPKASCFIKPVPLCEAIPFIPIKGILVCHPKDIPDDERSWFHSLFYRFQIWLYSAYSPMQPNLPPIDAEPNRALKHAVTWLHRTKFNVPELPAEFLGSPDLGSLAVRGPYACYTEKGEDGIYKWDLETLGQYDHHDGLQKLGVKVLFKVDLVRRALHAFQIDTALGSVTPEDSSWELAKKIALCTATTHLSLVRHFNGVHLASGAHLAIATRNQLPFEHPLGRLLWPYIYGTAQSNDIVTRGQMARGGDFEAIFSLTFEGMCQLFEETYRDFRFVVNDPEADGNARRIRNQEFDTPTQDNLETLFNVMHEHTRRYLRLYYPDDQPNSSTLAIRQDASLGGWLDELNDLIPHGVEVDRSNVTFDSLARLMTRFMYLVTVQHEILGSFLWNYQLWSHRQPVRIYRNGQRVPLDVYQRLVNANYNLNVKRRALMFDFSYLALDAAGAAALVKFNQELKRLRLSMGQQPWAIWKLYPDALKVNINA